MDVSLFSRLSLIGTVMFAVLWWITPGDILYETVEMEIVSLKRVFLYIAFACFGFWIYAAFWL